jgi:hypothetical protein
MQVVFQIHLSLILTGSKSEGLKSVSEGFGYGDTVDKWFHTTVIQGLQSDSI